MINTYVSLMYELKNNERYLRVNLLGPHRIHKCTNTLYDYAIINY